MKTSKGYAQSVNVSFTLAYLQSAEDVVMFEINQWEMEFDNA